MSCGIRSVEDDNRSRTSLVTVSLDTVTPMPLEAIACM
jgi:hypothetical protein